MSTCKGGCLQLLCPTEWWNWISLPEHFKARRSENHNHVYMIFMHDQVAFHCSGYLPCVLSNWSVGCSSSRWEEDRSLPQETFLGTHWIEQRGEDSGQSTCIPQKIDALNMKPSSFFVASSLLTCQATLVQVAGVKQILKGSGEPLAAIVPGEESGWNTSSSPFASCFSSLHCMLPFDLSCHCSVQKLWTTPQCQENSSPVTHSSHPYFPSSSHCLHHCP